MQDSFHQQEHPKIDGWFRWVSFLKWSFLRGHLWILGGVALLLMEEILQWISGSDSASNSTIHHHPRLLQNKTLENSIMSTEKKHLTFHYTGWLIEIRDPYNIWVGFHPLYTPTTPGWFSWTWGYQHLPFTPRVSFTGRSQDWVSTRWARSRADR